MYREIEIRGEILPWRLDPHTVYETHEGVRLLASHCVCSQAIVGAIDDAQAHGVRVLLVRLDSPGGSAPAGFAVYERLRRFSRDGGNVVVFIEHTAGSVATIIGVAGDVVVMAPTARGYVCHGAATGDGRSPQDINSALVDILAARTLSHRIALENAHRDRFVHVEVRPADALDLGWADRLGSLEEARRLAGRIAGGHRPSTIRSRALAQQPEADVRLPESSATATLTYPLCGLDGVVLRIDSIKRNEDLSIRIEATEMKEGAGYAVARNLSTSDGGTTFSQWDSVEVIRHTAAVRNWTMRTVTGEWYGVEWNGEKFVAVGDNAIATSPDALTWTSRTVPAGTPTYNRVRWNGTVFCAIGSYGACATSGDGEAWTARTLPTTATNVWYDVCWNGSTFVAVGLSSGCATSPDGITWTARTIPAGGYYSVTWDGHVFCAVGQPGLCATSPDGVTWTARTIPYLLFTAVRSNGQRLVAVDNSSGVAYSDDHGATWTNTAGVPGNVVRHLSSVAWTGRTFVVVERSGGASAACYTSTDGALWDILHTSMPNPGTGWRDVAWTGWQAVAVGHNSVATSLAV